jgi:2-aminoadipate transaminase
MNYRFSSYGQASTVPSPVNMMMAAFANDFRDGTDINLGVGYVNEKTIPDTLLVEAMQGVAAHPEQYRQPFNYGGPHGSPNLIDALRRFYSQHHIGGLDACTLQDADIVIGPSGATSILDALADLFAPGIVVTADPMYYIYCNQLERKGFRVLTIPEDEDGLPPEAVESQLEALGDGIGDLSFFYVVTANNPSGTILSNQRKQALTALAARYSEKCGHYVPIFFDQAYEWLLHDPSVERPLSAMLCNGQGLAYEIGTLSKVLAPALRIGFIMGKGGPLLNAIAQKTSDVGFSAPLINQEMAAYMLDNHIGVQLRRVNEEYRTKARAVKEAIDAILGPWLEDCRGGQAGFYYYLTLRNVRTDTASPFFAFLSRKTGDTVVDGVPDQLRPRVIYLPGEFCVHPRGASAQAGTRQLRLSYGFEETPVIIRALEYMREAILYSLAQ